MTADEFRAWRHYLGLSINGSAKALGKHRSMIQRYQNGKVAVPEHVKILCRKLFEEVAA